MVAAAGMALGLQTVRTNLDKRDGVDRATLKRLAEIAPDKMLRDRDELMRKRRRTLPAEVKARVEKAADMHKKAKGLS